MAFRSGNRRNFGGGNYGNAGAMGRNMNPWDNQNANGGNFGNMRQGGGGGGGQGMNAEALTLANNLLNNLLRNQNPPSLLDLPRGGGGGIGGNRGTRQVGNRPGGNRNNRRVQGGFVRGGSKTGNKQGGGIRKQNAFDRAKKLLAKNSKNKKDSANGDKTEKKKSESAKESIYADVPNDMFYCHLCKKHMWDSNSFENHIKGRTHLMMREGIEESYRLKANMIRQEAKIAEQLKLIELDRLKRMGKSGKSHKTEYCTMCDLHFHGHLSSHRKSEGHLTLKKFLHPKCLECSKEFPTRIEFDTHLLTPDHLKKAAERNTKVGERKKNTLTVLTEEDELKDVKQPTKKKKKTEVKKEGEGEEGAEKEEEEDDEANQTVIEDPEDVILDYNEGEEIPVEIDARIPKYNWQRAVGCSLITKLECFECALCGRFFDNEKTAEIHSRTAYHHRQFVKFLNEKASDTKIAQKRAAAAIEESERKKRKLEAAEAEEAAENGEVKEENGEGEEKAADELYDPSEATADDEDVEMNENPDDKKDAADENGTQDAEMKEEEDDAKEEIKEEKPDPPATPKSASPQKGAAAQKNTPNPRGAAAAKGTPRGRGRGRYNRY
ncbi:unnamed protein product [Hermetia illucens]|uniref:C2H2-type domain-containing protein n=1 Tax=Hermetia illucens TaxID=343691 RepID=A0A7R8UL66_HERIL|nr:unnamed protein product [Hermetia illucens]